MEKNILTGDVKELYRNKYVVMINVRFDGTGRNRSIGDVYSVHNTWEEAWKIKKVLEFEFGELEAGSTSPFCIVRGFRDDAIFLGGMFFE